ncbi:EAL and HDOD domain-containing protein [Noviherbaspirillum sp. Root189]|uniref:EAL and HDOD domain-containing protein n=1 Tax=Noviherbaspirillum sp. Root189 TaxID=1736487 RepID=UPI000709B191|nr:EAL domain-containing protein [Noviherbaspirillum sp. Root189]KRB87589.1 diguanylate phosphodiesterase [Noviherbaspirillum sp. Root189]
MSNVASAVSHDITRQSLPIRDFFLGRQPILNRDHQLVAYELLFRDADTESANITGDIAATASVIAHAVQLGLANVIGNHVGFINVDADLLSGDVVNFLPRQKVILEILETVEPTEDLIARVTELADAGFRFALDDVVACSDAVQKLLPLVEVIKVEITSVNVERLTELVRRFKMSGKTLLAEKVETQEQFALCMELGFDYFQGYYFARPTVLTGKKLRPSQVAVMQLLAKFTGDMDDAELEAIIRQDPSLALSLLRIVNAPLSGVERPIETLTDALSVFGRRQFYRWLQILLCAESGQSPARATVLLSLASTRGKLMELMAAKVDPEDHIVAGTAYTVGVLSLMDTLFAVPMEKLVEQLSLSGPVRDALLSRIGRLGEMLKLTECLERVRETGPVPTRLLEDLQLSADDLYQLQLQSIEWSEHVNTSEEFEN